MKRIKVIITLFIMFSASLMNFRDHSVSSVNFCNGSALVMCADSKNISRNPAPVNPVYPSMETTPAADSDIDNSGVDQSTTSGKNYEANMVIM